MPVVLCSSINGHNIHPLTEALYVYVSVYVDIKTPVTIPWHSRCQTGSHRSDHAAVETPASTTTIQLITTANRSAPAWACRTSSDVVYSTQTTNNNYNYNNYNYNNNNYYYYPVVLVVQWLSIGLLIKRSLVSLPARVLSSQLGQLSLPSLRGR